MTRSLKKGPFVAHHLLFQIESIIKDTEKKTIVTYSRSSTVIPIIIGYTIAVHNGREIIPILITDQIIGHKLGEFSFTRVPCSHVKQDKKAKRLKFLLWDKKRILLVFDLELISDLVRNGMQIVAIIGSLLRKTTIFVNIFIKITNTVLSPKL
jgi:small subunit ribosomal protein S19